MDRGSASSTPRLLSRPRGRRYGWGLGHFGSSRNTGSATLNLMHRFDPTKAHAVPGSVALRDAVFAPQGVAGESTRTVGG